MLIKLEHCTPSTQQYYDEYYKLYIVVTYETVCKYNIVLFSGIFFLCNLLC